MPELNVISDPASEPADPSAESADNAAAAADSSEPKQSMLRSALSGLGKGTLSLGASAARGVARGATNIVVAYPRHSMAAAASAVILAAVSYSQMSAGDSARRPIKNQIWSESTISNAKEPNPKDDPKGDPKAELKPDPTTVANSEISGTEKPPEPSPATAATTGSAPAPTTNLDTDPPLPALADAAAPASKVDEAPKKEAPPADLTAAAKPEPAPTPSPGPSQGPALDPSSPTLLAGAAAEPAPNPSAPAAKDSKASLEAINAAPPLEPTPSAVAAASTPAHSGDPAPSPAPPGDPLQLATNIEPATADAHQPAPTPTPTPAAAANPLDLKPNEPAPSPEIKGAAVAGAAAATGAAAAIAGTLAATRPQALGSPAAAPPELTKADGKIEPPKSDLTKAQGPDPAPATPAPAPPVVAGAGAEATPPGGDLATTAKAAAPGAAPPHDADAPTAKNALSPLPGPSAVAAGSTAAAATVAAAAAGAATALAIESKPTATEPKPIETPSPDAKLATSNSGKSDGTGAGTSTGETPAPPKRAVSQDLASDGWVSVPNAGKLPVEGMADATGSGGGAGADGQGGSSPIRDARAHAAKDADFELESPRSQGTSSASGQNAARIAAAAAGAGLAAGTGTAIAAAARPTSTSGRVDSVPHVVEKNENFWTISRLYYSSGRYYRALWKANAEQFPDIRKLKVNDVINIPAVEDLDPTYIDPPRSRAPTHLTGASRNPGAVARGGSPDRSSEPADSPLSSSVAPRDEAFSTARTNRAGNDGVPVKRSSRSDADLDLPPSDTISRRSPAPDRTGRPVDRPLGDDTQADDPPSSRTSARSGATSPRRPAYKVRQFDTLRSIARDMLGDSHRGSEILDLNRDLIDDPAHLTVGQVIELPDDARTSVRRTRRDP